MNTPVVESWPSRLYFMAMCAFFSYALITGKAGAPKARSYRPLTVRQARLIGAIGVTVSLGLTFLPELYQLADLVRRLLPVR